MKSVGLITIHSIYNFGSMLQAYATQVIVSRLGYKVSIINYKYPNEYHDKEYKKSSPYAAANKINWLTKLKIALYARTFMKYDRRNKIKLFNDVRHQLLKETQEYPSIESIHETPPKFDIYLTGSDQVWNPRYMYKDLTYLLDFVHDVPKVAYSASFGTTSLNKEFQDIYRPLLQEYNSISLREQSGVQIVKEICNKEAECTCDPTLLLNEEEWYEIFNDKPLVNGDYILCYILTYTANPYPYASRLIKHIQKHLHKKVVILDENCKYWLDFRYKSYRSYGPREIINLFQHASFIISSSFHGTAFSVNFKKNFYSLFPNGVNDERQKSLLRIIGAEDRLIKINDPLPDPSTFEIYDWNNITSRLNAYRQKSINYLSKALNNAAQLTK